MLIDDNPDDNFYHERVIKRNNAADTIIAKKTGMAALEYLKSQKDGNCRHPDLIFLDINMPGMNGWEFLQEYEKLDKDLQSQAIVIMLTTSENPDDRLKSMSIVPEFKTKPLTAEILEEVINKHF
jgi:CheY-like chemotaxis protein